MGWTLVYEHDGRPQAPVDSAVRHHLPLRSSSQASGNGDRCDGPAHAPSWVGPFLSESLVRRPILWAKMWTTLKHLWIVSPVNALKQFPSANRTQKTRKERTFRDSGPQVWERL